MDISIIIGLLIALVIICATTVVNNLINKNYLDLKVKWNNRTRVLYDITHYASKIEEFTDDLMTDNLSDDTKKRLLSYKDSVNSILSNIKSYEKEAL